MMMKKIPQDPVMCLSFINTQLRDYYEDLDALCEDFQADKQALIQKLGDAGYTYQPVQNQFR